MNRGHRDHGEVIGVLREWLKGALCLVVLAGVVITLLSWSTSRPSPATETYRIIGPLIGAMALLGFLFLHFRGDTAPDFLFQDAGRYFDRGGFCFVPQAGLASGCPVLLIRFQNRFSRPCHASVALRPARGFFLARAPVEVIGCDIDCGPGAYGVITVPFPVPKELQGTRQLFEVGASVDYPQGRGKRLRNRDGLVIRRNSSFRSGFTAAVALAGAAAGTIVFASPATVTLTLPAGEAESSPDPEPKVSVLWMLGEPHPPS